MGVLNSHGISTLKSGENIGIVEYIPILAFPYFPEAEDSQNIKFNMIVKGFIMEPIFGDIEHVIFIYACKIRVVHLVLLDRLVHKRVVYWHLLKRCFMFS